MALDSSVLEESKVTADDFASIFKKLCNSLFILLRDSRKCQAASVSYNKHKVTDESEHKAAVKCSKPKSTGGPKGVPRS
jgi:hypothetical protein